jgi:oxepin-CoA hydrolase/3-oxo-5,6-dehydrosuberyl-CoA semialdehyde dehydrogenase
MAVVPLTSPNLNIFERRIGAIQPESRRRWGKLEPAAVLRHLRAAVELSLGEVAFRDQSTFFSRTVGRRIVFRSWMPWPKGKIKAPDELTPAAEGDCDQERAKLLEAIRRFVAAAEREPERTGLHTMFGPMTLKEWQRAHGKHFEHHFEQYGV